VELFAWPWKEVESFLLILVRVGIVLFLFPFFSSRLIPVHCKAGLCLLLTVLFFPVVDLGSARLPSSGAGVFHLILSELAAGMILGLMVQVFFEAVRMMGQLVGFQTGFAITNILDPQSGIQVSILSNMAYLVALVLFLSLDGHHIFLRALKESYEILPVGAFSLKGESFAEWTGKFRDLFVLSVKMGAPAIVGLLFLKAALGLVTKAIPQMNVMIVAFPLQIVVGLFFFGVSLRVLLMLTEKYLADLAPLLINTMARMKG
jgi:flagellar biosynthesis protein FliR